MAQKLNKILCSIFIALFILKIGAQEKDYKSPKTFELFNIKRKCVSAWQMEQLKSGVLIVRLDAQRKSIMHLLQLGDTVSALYLAAVTAQKNKHRVRAFLKAYSFSKVLFMYNFFSDSLRAGKTQGIFLDSNLLRLPNVNLQNSFYLLADEDYIFNSSIGFVPEDSADFVKEHGYPVRKMAIVLKNKYGHQLKSPFPYFQKDRTLSKTLYSFMCLNDSHVFFYFPLVNAIKYPKRVELEKSYTPERQVQIVEEWNEKLGTYFQNLKSNIPLNIPESFKPLLY